MHDRRMRRKELSSRSPARREWRRHVRTALEIAVCLAAAAWGRGATAAELHLRSQATAGGALVTLGDVAEIRAADAATGDALAAIELFPAPAPGSQRFLRVRELQDLLVLRGVDLAAHRLTGAAQVAIHGAETARAAERLGAAAVRRAHRELNEALVQHLSAQVPGSSGWQVEVALGEEQWHALSRGPMVVRGGQPPWVGRQQFEVTAGAGGEQAPLPVEAHVTLSPTTVVTTRALPRGAIVRGDDVVLTRATAGEGSAEPIRSVEEVVGQEVTRAVASGATLDRRAVRPPQLVRRGEVVTVYARAAGIQVRTHARAREDGAEGDLIHVESITERSTFLARVSGVREVEVYARAPRAH